MCAGVRIPHHPPLLQLFKDRGIEQLVARQAHNLEVVGSSPTPATIWFCGVVINMPLCHRGDRGFDSRQDRHLWFHSSVGRATD